VREERENGGRNKKEDTITAMGIKR